MLAGNKYKLLILILILINIVKVFSQILNNNSTTNRIENVTSPPSTKTVTPTRATTTTTKTTIRNSQVATTPSINPTPALTNTTELYYYENIHLEFLTPANNTEISSNQQIEITWTCDTVEDINKNHFIVISDLVNNKGNIIAYSVDINSKKVATTIGPLDNKVKEYVLWFYDSQVYSQPGPILINKEYIDLTSLNIIADTESENFTNTKTVWIIMIAAVLITVLFLVILLYKDKQREKKKVKEKFNIMDEYPLTPSGKKKGLVMDPTLYSINLGEDKKAAAPKEKLFNSMEREKNNHFAGETNSQHSSHTYSNNNIGNDMDMNELNEKYVSDRLGHNIVSMKSNNINTSLSEDDTLQKLNSFSPQGPNEDSISSEKPILKNANVNNITSPHHFNQELRRNNNNNNYNFNGHTTTTTTNTTNNSLNRYISPKMNSSIPLSSATAIATTTTTNVGGKNKKDQMTNDDYVSYSTNGQNKIIKGLDKLESSGPNNNTNKFNDRYNINSKSSNNNNTYYNNIYKKGFDEDQLETVYRSTQMNHLTLMPLSATITTAEEYLATHDSVDFSVKSLRSSSMTNTTSSTRDSFNSNDIVAPLSPIVKSPPYASMNSTLPLPTQPSMKFMKKEVGMDKKEFTQDKYYSNKRNSLKADIFEVSDKVQEEKRISDDVISNDTFNVKVKRNSDETDEYNSSVYVDSSFNESFSDELNYIESQIQQQNIYRQQLQQQQLQQQQLQQQHLQRLKQRNQLPLNNQQRQLEDQQYLQLQKQQQQLLQLQEEQKQQQQLLLNQQKILMQQSQQFQMANENRMNKMYRHGGIMGEEEEGEEENINQNNLISLNNKSGSSNNNINSNNQLETTTTDSDDVETIVATHVCKAWYSPCMPDELKMCPGDELIIIERFNDGWGFGQNTKGNVGVFPLDCISEIQLNDTNENENLDFEDNEPPNSGPHGEFINPDPYGYMKNNNGMTERSVVNLRESITSGVSSSLDYSELRYPSLNTLEDLLKGKRISQQDFETMNKLRRESSSIEL